MVGLSLRTWRRPALWKGFSRTKNSVNFQKIRSEQIHAEKRIKTLTWLFDYFSGSAKQNLNCGHKNKRVAIKKGWPVGNLPIFLASQVSMLMGNASTPCPVKGCHVPICLTGRKVKIGDFNISASTPKVLYQNCQRKRYPQQRSLIGTNRATHTITVDTICL